MVLCWAYLRLLDKGPLVWGYAGKRIVLQKGMKKCVHFFLIQHSFFNLGLAILSCLELQFFLFRKSPLTSVLFFHFLKMFLQLFFCNVISWQLYVHLKPNFSPACWCLKKSLSFLSQCFYIRFYDIVSWDLRIWSC